MKKLYSFFLYLCACGFITSNTFAQFSVVSLETNQFQTPLGIDEGQPRFSWLVESPDSVTQTAYILIVTDEEDQEVWNTGRIENSTSREVVYEGPALQPETRYRWQVTIWDTQNNQSVASTWFETGLMNADIAAWDGAAWIGGDDSDLVFQSHYLPVFKIKYTLQLDRSTRSTRAAFVWGANDSRLIDPDNALIDQAYFAFELDITEVDGSGAGQALLNVYRVGYHPDDSPDWPYAQLPIPTTLINNSNKYEAHDVFLNVLNGVVTIYMDGLNEEYLVAENESLLLPGYAASNTGFISDQKAMRSIPVLADMGFKIPAGQKAWFSNIEVRHFRTPSNLLFSEDLSDPMAYDGPFVSALGTGLSIENKSYLVEGRTDDFLVVANPSRNGMPMLRTEFNLEDKSIFKARLYVTARGLYQMHLNGERIRQGHVNPGFTYQPHHHNYQTYDVTGIVRAGSRNALGAMLGEDLWSGTNSWGNSQQIPFNQRQSLLARLVVTYQDGSIQTVQTAPGSWTTFNEGPLRYASFLRGELYDATREIDIDGWDIPGFDDSQWKPARLIPATSMDELAHEKVSLIGQPGRPAVIETRIASSVEEVSPGVFVYDMGPGMAGIPEIDILGGQTNQRISLRYLETSFPDLSQVFDTTGLKIITDNASIDSQDRYILIKFPSTVSPRFTYREYRYVEIKGIEEALPLEAVKGHVIRIQASQ